MLNDRLVRLSFARHLRQALLGMVGPAAVFFVNLLAAELCAEILFSAMG